MATGFKTGTEQYIEYEKSTVNGVRTTLIHRPSIIRADALPNGNARVYLKDGNSVVLSNVNRDQLLEQLDPIVAWWRKGEA